MLQQIHYYTQYIITVEWYKVVVLMHYWAYLWLIHSMKFSGHWLRSAWYQAEKLGQRIGHLANFLCSCSLFFFCVCHITSKFQEVKRGRSFAFCWQLTHNDSSFTKISVDVTSCHVFRDRVTFHVFRANDLWLYTTIWHEYKKTNLRITQKPLSTVQQYS